MLLKHFLCSHYNIKQFWNVTGYLFHLVGPYFFFLLFFSTMFMYLITNFISYLFNSFFLPFWIFSLGIFIKKINQIAGLTFCSITPLPLILLHYLIEQYIVAYVWLPIKQWSLLQKRRKKISWRVQFRNKQIDSEISIINCNWCPVCIIHDVCIVKLAEQY